MSIYCHATLGEPEKELLRQKLPDDTIYFKDEVKDRLQAFQQCEVVLGNPPPAWLENSKHIKWVQLDSAGLDPYQALIRKGDILFSNLRGFYRRPVAETALAGILYFYRCLDRLGEKQEEKEWAYAQIRNECESLYNKKVLILGAGSIARNIRIYLSVFECHISVYDPKPERSDYTLASLEEALPEVDILVGCLAATKETINLLDRKRLSLLPQKALLVNVGRGSLIDEEALIDLLREGQLKGAFLDVTRQEPLPSDSPLWTVPNLFLSQHTGGGTREELRDIASYFIYNYERYKQNQAENIVSGI